MKVAVLFSGGKDSTMAVYNALETGEDVKYLLSMKSVNDESYMFHVPNIHITDLLAEALDIPIITAQTQGIKEEELEDLKMAFIKLKDLGVEAIYTGALYSVYQKSRIEKLGGEVGLEIISPYWHVDELEYMRKIVSLGFEVIISGVFRLSQAAARGGPSGDEGQDRGGGTQQTMKEVLLYGRNGT